MHNSDAVTESRTQQTGSRPQPPAGKSSAAKKWVYLFIALVAFLVLAKVTHLKSRIRPWFHPAPPENKQRQFPPQVQGPIATGKPDPEIRFEKVALPITKGIKFTCVLMSPDGLLYAGGDDGRIYRYPIQQDGTLAKPQVITSLQVAEHGNRLLTGFCFDPASTPENPIIWVCHNYPAVREAPEFTSKLSRISGKNLEKVEDVLVHLPRSYNDHLTNQPGFGPDGALYIPQGSNSSSGGPDDYWGNRPERLLNGTILRLDVSKVTPGRPIDVLTPDAGGTYDPYARHAPLTIYAGGLRNAYDLVWASDGRLYVPVNGAGAGGNTPAGDGVPALTNLPEAEDDWLFRITPGKYYGHPNPQQHHFVLNGGNPDGVPHSYTVAQYPVGTKPDPDWVPAILDVGSHCSADGIIQYRGPQFGGKLDRSLLICRYNAGSDILCVQLDSDGNVRRVQSGMPGMTDFAGALDLTEDVRNGNLYVSEYLGRRLTLLRPTVAPSSMPATQPSSDTGSGKSLPDSRPTGG